MVKKIAILAGLILIACSAYAQFESPFVVTSKIKEQNGEQVFEIEVKVPKGHYLYADEFIAVDSEGKKQPPLQIPRPVEWLDPFTKKRKNVFKENFQVRYRIPPGNKITITLFGCTDAICFPPVKKMFTAGPRASGGPAGPKQTVPFYMAPAEKSWKSPAERFLTVDRAVGYLPADKFIAFLRQDKESRGGFLKRFAASPTTFFSRFGWGWTVLLVLAGGLLLNLTPCVLPMIPINLAIIGAGAQSASRWRGFALGGAYGFGIAAAYGALGLIVVLTGSQFGALNASPWFNLVIAAIFLLLGLAVFEVLPIDFSRFQTGAGSGGGKQRITVAFTMGAVAALLAGACVAPVVIAVLLLSGRLYAGGASLGLTLPFLLGAGMALPWCLAGAGLSFLPKPGSWMNAVKALFGILILLLSLYYGYLGYRLFTYPASGLEGGTGSGKASTVTLVSGLEKALEQNKPVVIDFWASWCKSCSAMSRTTLVDGRVLAELKRFVFIKFQAENPSDPKTLEVLRHFGVKGLPSFVMLRPN
jgi:thiol:disulfide interchange protein